MTAPAPAPGQHSAAVPLAKKHWRIATSAVVTMPSQFTSAARQAGSVEPKQFCMNAKSLRSQVPSPLTSHSQRSHPSRQKSSAMTQFW